MFVLSQVDKCHPKALCRMKKASNLKLCMNKIELIQVNGLIDGIINDDFLNKLIEKNK